MPQKLDVAGVRGQCPVCHHPPIRHVSDGTGATCLVCLWLAEQAKLYGKLPVNVCTCRFTFKLSQRERDQAEKATKTSYPQMTVCAECGLEWRGHSGYLCPDGDSTFVPLLDSSQPFIVFGLDKETK